MAPIAGEPSAPTCGWRRYWSAPFAPSRQGDSMPGRHGGAHSRRRIPARPARRSSLRLVITHPLAFTPGTRLVLSPFDRSKAHGRPEPSRGTRASAPSLASGARNADWRHARAVSRDRQAGSRRYGAGVWRPRHQAQSRCRAQSAARRRPEWSSARRSTCRQNRQQGARRS